MSNLIRGVCLSLACLCLAGAVQAHTHLEGSVPAAHAKIAPPSEIRLTFSEPVEAALSQIAVKTPAGEAVGAGKVASDPGDKAVLILSLPQPLAPGSYTVDWRVVSADTHKMHGNFTFEVKP